MNFEIWPLTLKLIFLLAPFFIGLGGVAMSCYIALLKDFDVAMSSITSNFYLESVKVSWGTKGLRSRWQLLNTVAGILSTASLQIMLGLVDPTEIKNFPPPLRSRILIASWLEIVALLWLVIGYFIIR